MQKYIMKTEKRISKYGNIITTIMIVLKVFKTINKRFFFNKYYKYLLLNINYHFKTTCSQFYMKLKCLTMQTLVPIILN